jgi:hypothetical protein
MNNNPYLMNPVARMLFEAHFQKIFEANVPELNDFSKKLTDLTFTIWQTLAFDIEKDYKRTAEVVKKRYAAVAQSKNFAELKANMEADEIDSDVRDAYKDGNDNTEEKYKLALSSAFDVMENLIKADPGQEENIIAQVKSKCTDSASAINAMVQYSKDAEDKASTKKNESITYNSGNEKLNESFLQGYKGRIRELKRKINDKVLAAVGKTKTNGYSQDWPSVFAVMKDSLFKLDTTDGAGTKDRNALDEFDKTFLKTSQDFASDVSKAVETSYNKLVNGKPLEDPKLEQSLVDFRTNFDKLQTLKAKADQSRADADKKIKDDHHEKVADTIKSIFPLKKGDSDNDSRFKDSGIILAIQNALCGIPAAAKLIKANNGPNGNFGPATAAVVSAIQKNQYGNKAVTGQVDHGFLLDLVSDKTSFVTPEMRDAIKKSCGILGESLK